MLGSTSVYLVKQDSCARFMTWQVEMFLCDLEEGDYARTGDVRFEGVEQVEVLHDLQGGLLDGEVF